MLTNTTFDFNNVLVNVEIYINQGKSANKLYLSKSIAT